VSADAEAGNHSVTVNQIAKNDIWVNSSTGYSARTDTVTDTDGSMTISYAGTDYAIAVPAGTTLSGLVSLINNDSALGGDVKATALYDGSSYRLQLRGMDLGKDNTVAVTGSTLAGYAASDFEHTQTAQNAEIKVDGYPTGADEWMELTTNTVKDVIPGLTMTLKGATTDASVSVAVDTDAMKTNIQNFVSAVNEIIATIQDAYKYTDKTDDTSSTDSDDSDDATGELAGESTVKAGTLSGNYGVGIVNSMFKSVLTGEAIGFERYDAATSSGDLYATLSQIGITTDATEGSATFGQLVIDNTALDAALEDNPEAVAKLFSTSGTGSSNSSDVSFKSLLSGVTEAGAYQVAYVVEDGQLKSATINGHAAAVSGWSITGLSGNAEAGLEIGVDDRTDGSRTADVDVSQGKIPELIKSLKSMTVSDSGVLSIIEDSWQTTIDDLTTRITDEQARLDSKKSTLTDQFSKLDTLLGQYKNIQTQLESTIDQLTAS
jgi:flagellar hook-associated protein 2